MSYIVGKRRTRNLIVTKGPVASSISGGERSAILFQELEVIIGTANLNAEAIAIGVFYNVASGEFTWADQDGLFTLVNVGAFSGGQLVATGNGKGTLVAHVKNTIPFFSTAFKKA